MTLYTQHPIALQTMYSDVKRRALEQSFVLVGTPGSVGERNVAGNTFLYRQFYDPAGKKRADYIGSAADPDVRAHEQSIRDAIATTNALLADVRILARAGYVRVDSRTNAALAPLVNHGLFRSGATIIGSHAYGALLNELGVRAAAYRTDDVDVARGARLSLRGDPISFERILAESTLTLSPILGFDRKPVATSYKTPGRDALRVDLVAPTTRSEPIVVPVPELQAHAMGLPQLAYLLEAPIDAVVLGRDAVLPIRVPRPERFAWHKLVVSGLRAHTSEKKSKDVLQASVLIACLGENESGALEEAFHAIPTSIRRKIGPAMRAVRDTLEREKHDAAAELLDRLK